MLFFVGEVENSPLSALLPCFLLSLSFALSIFHVNDSMCSLLDFDRFLSHHLCRSNVLSSPLILP